MRISDWSSDVCSSDLAVVAEATLRARIAAKTAASAAIAEGHGGIAVAVDLAAVILRALRLVGQQVVRLGDVGEFLRRLGIVLVLVGMQFLGELAIGGLDLRIARTLRNAQDRKSTRLNSSH